MSTHTTRPTEPATAGRGPRPVPVWAVAATAAAAALAVWCVAVPLAGATLAVPGGRGTTTVGPAAVALTAVVGVLLAWPVRAGLARSRRGPRVRAWRLTCAVVLLVSLAGPLGATTTASTCALVAMHVAVGAVVVVGLDPRRAAVRPVGGGR